MARIIRICKIAHYAVVLPAILLTAQSVLAGTPGVSPLRLYATGRFAEIEGENDVAAVAYAAALAVSPSDGDLALRAYRGAMQAGNRDLAIRAARTLDTQKILPADGQILLYLDRLERRDWVGARASLVKLTKFAKPGGQNTLEFLAPLLLAWTEFGAGGDPIKILDEIDKKTLAGVYAGEQKILILLARKRTHAGLDAVGAIASPDTRGVSLRLAAAAQLALLGEKSAAIDILKGEDEALVAARALVTAGKPLAGAVNTPRYGVAHLLARFASDIMRDRPSPIAITVARLAAFAAPESDYANLMFAQALLASEQTDTALETLERIKSSSVFAATARELRIETLQQANRNQEALVFAKAAASAPGASVTDQVLLGQSYTRTARFDDAAATYDALIKRLDGAARVANPISAGAPWTLWLLYGGALDSAKDWLRAEPALRRAVALGPNQPAALNYLGYAMLEHGKNLDEATRMIAKASVLSPNDAAIIDSLGWAFFKRGDTMQAITILERAVASDPTISETSEHLGDAYWSAGRYVDARYTWHAALIQAEGEGLTARLKSKIANGIVAK